MIGTSNDQHGYNGLVKERNAGLTPKALTDWESKEGLLDSDTIESALITVSPSSFFSTTLSLMTKGAKSSKTFQRLLEKCFPFGLRRGTGPPFEFSPREMLDQREGWLVPSIFEFW